MHSASAKALEQRVMLSATPLASLADLDMETLGGDGDLVDSDLADTVGDSEQSIVDSTRSSIFVFVDSSVSELAEHLDQSL